MPLFPFFERVNVADHVKQLNLASYTPEIRLDGLVRGVDNIRHDVFLSPKFCEVAGGHLFKLIAKYGNVEDFVKEDTLLGNLRPGNVLWNRPGTPVPRPPEPVNDFKRLLSELQIYSLSQAKAAANISIDVLGRLAVLKFLRVELAIQFGHVLEKCRTKLRAWEGPRSGPRGITLRDRFLQLQVSKKIVLRKAAQDVFATLREVEKESAARMRRSLFGEVSEQPAYEMFMNRLLFTEDAKDDFLNAEHYVMLGNYERDPDRFTFIVEAASDFFHRIGLLEDYEGDTSRLDAWMNAPENAQELVGGGTPDDGTPMGKGQRALLSVWTDTLEQAGVLTHIIASYEVVPLLAEYSPLINPQQLKNALVSRSERKRVEQLLDEHGRISAEKLHVTVRRVEAYGGHEKAKIAGRFMVDFMKYHRDLRRLETLNSAMDSINIIANEKLRELSAINNTLYEFLLPEEQKRTEDRITSHVILKADIRDSTYLTRTLSERGLNPASYFSLNFYDPINKLLPKYGATKVFIEGDAVILAMFEREGEQNFVVARTCMLAREMIEIVRGYNELSQNSGLPILELGIGICFQDSAPMYLMDGSNRIMISKALNESDRLSSCGKATRKYTVLAKSMFNVFSFKTVEDADTGGTPEEFLMRYNLGGIHVNEAAFQKLRQEISLQLHEFDLQGLWGRERVRLFSGLVPVGTGSFHRIVVREANIPDINAADFSLKKWTDRRYYEVCTSAALYEMIEARNSAT
jgi:hypothetical protein